MPTPHLLLVQRAANERSYPNKWEVPGGSCEASDPTVLHSLARETFEETGLRLTKVTRQIGSGVDFVTGYGARTKSWCKLSFEIEVAEILGCVLNCGKLGGHGMMGPKEDVAEGEADRADGCGVTVTLDPEEHQAYAWVSEKEIRDGNYAIMTAEQKDLMLEAFTLRKADEDSASAHIEGATSVAREDGTSKERLNVRN